MGLKESVEWLTFVTVLSGLIYWIRCTRISDLRLKIDKPLFKEMTIYGGKTYVTSIVTFLVIRGNLFLINAWLGEAQSGIYSITIQIFDLIYILPSTLGIILFPKISSDSSNSGELTAKVFRFSVLVIGCLCLGLIIFGRELILVLYGTKFLDGVTALYWLTPGILAYSLVNILMNDLAGRGFPLVLVFAPMVGLFVQVMLNVFLIKQYGLMIPALSSTVAFIIMLAALVARFKKETRIGLSKMLFFTIEDLRSIRF
jgi:O-antigen/teichoic acid export membrane protein